MLHHEAKLLVISALAPIELIEEVLGESSFREHTIGSVRDSGLVRKQTIWSRKFSFEREMLEDVVCEILDWLADRFDALKSLDPAVFCKICCALHADDGHDGFAVNPSMARKLTDLGVLLLLDVKHGKAD